MWKVTLCLAFAISAVACDGTCGVSKAPAAGVNDATVFPWTSLIYFQKDSNEPKPLAMGTLIDKKHVLVPAFVVNLEKPQLKFVQFGRADLGNAGSSQNYEVEKVIIHPEYTRNRAPGTPHNIAIIRLKQHVSFSDTVSPACLPVKGKDYTADQYHHVSFNAISAVTEDVKGKRTVSILPSVKRPECEAAYGKISKKEFISELDDSFVCAGDKENDTCRGDSGSALLLQKDGAWTAVSMSIFGPSICRNGTPSVFMRIQPYVDWIQTAVNQA